MKRRSFLAQAVSATVGAMLSCNSSHLAEAEAISGGPRFDVDDSQAQRTRRDFFYKPLGGRVGDVIPFFDDGVFRIFHLYKADGVPYDTTWHQVTTTNFIDFKELGEMLGAGNPGDQDRSVATGSVIKRGGKYHAFYTGYRSRSETGRPEQGILHAISDDAVTWRKLPEDTFYANEGHYERDDWRDPFVFWNNEAEEYWMLSAARLRTGPRRRRGCTALSVSKDLSKWEPREPFWAPGLFYTHECPDLFKMGDWWYLVFSEFSKSFQTRYRMSGNISGPWHAPEIDTFDTRALYAAKSASDGHNRYLFGWNPLKTGANDSGQWEWGGNLVVHELVQRPDGELYVRLPDSIGAAFSQSQPLRIQPLIGSSKSEGGTIRIEAKDDFSACELAHLPSRCKVTGNIRFQRGCRSFGLMLKLLDDLDTCYYVRFEVQNRRVVFDRWPRPGDVPFMTGLERQADLSPDRSYTIQIVMDGSIAEVYVDGITAMSTRLYGTVPGKLAGFAEGGTAIFNSVGVHSMAEDEV